MYILYIMKIKVYIHTEAEIKSQNNLFSCNSRSILPLYSACNYFWRTPPTASCFLSSLSTCISGNPKSEVTTGEGLGTYKCQAFPTGQLKLVEMLQMSTGL